MRLVWFSTWVVALVAYVLIAGSLLHWFDTQRAKGSQGFGEMLDTIVMMVLYVPRTLAAPLAAWLAYRRSTRHALEPAPPELPPVPAPPSNVLQAFPWLLGAVADLFLCLPVGAWIAGALLQNRKSTAFREAIAWARTAWILAWIASGVLWLLAIGLAFGATGDGKSTELSNAQTIAVLITMAVRALVAPVAGWLAFRYKVARFALPPAPAGSLPPLVPKG
jgi:hypothetical protein